MTLVENSILNTRREAFRAWSENNQRLRYVVKSLSASYSNSFSPHIGTQVCKFPTGCAIFSSLSGQKVCISFSPWKLCVLCSLIPSFLLAQERGNLDFFRRKNRGGGICCQFPALEHGHIIDDNWILAPLSGRTQLFSLELCLYSMLPRWRSGEVFCYHVWRNG